MTIDNDNLLNSILESLDRVKYISPEDIPNIDLYMDQVTTFMDSHLQSAARYPGEDKILTKTMINNYAKSDLLPPPVKKKYSREHVMLLVFIYYYKGILSINDIQTLLKPITEHYFQNGQAYDMEAIYREAFGMEDKMLQWRRSSGFPRKPFRAPPRRTWSSSISSPLSARWVLTYI